MHEYAFPRDLLAGIKGRWQTLPGQPFTLPEDSLLQRLLETCYHASFRSSEQRPVQCVLGYAPLSQIRSGVLQLGGQPVMLTASELARLAPATQHRRTVIGCDDSAGWLRIWGFFDHGHTWVQHAAGDPPAAPVRATDFPPDCLTVTVDGPGSLTISQGRAGLVRLREGRVAFPRENPFHTRQGPLGQFFHRLIEDLLRSPRPCESTAVSERNRGAGSLQGLYATSVLAILERIRLSQHGGSVVIARRPLPSHQAHLTYTVSEHQGLGEDILAYQRLSDLLNGTMAPADAVAEPDRGSPAADLRRVSQQLIRGISQISLLAAVDGAVLLDGQLRIGGFGVRFPILLPPGMTVEDALTGEPHFCDRWGLRHQSIFSICHQSEHAIGFIVSQDGDVKAVKAEGSRLFLWDEILD